MGASWPVVLLVVWLLACRVAAEAHGEDQVVVVRAVRELVEIRAHRAPLGRVLEAVAAHQGATVRYDGSRPTRLVSVSVFARRPEDALTALLTRERLRYALSLDPRTRRLRVLIVVSGETSPVSVARPTPEPAAPAGWRPDPVATIDEPPLPDHPSPPDR